MNTRPNTRVILACATLAPRCGPIEAPFVIWRLAHQGTTAVALAGIGDAAVSIPALCTKHAVEDLAAVVSGLRNTICLAHGLDLAFLQNVWGWATRIKFAPSCDPASRAWRHICTPFGKANRAHTIGDLHGCLETDKGEIVLHRPGIVLRVSVHLRCPTVLLTATRLRHLVLAGDDIEVGGPHAMSCCEHPIRVDELTSAPGRTIRAPAQTHLPPPLTFSSWPPIHDRRVWKPSL